MFWTGELCMKGCAVCFSLYPIYYENEIYCFIIQIHVLKLLVALVSIIAEMVPDITAIIFTVGQSSNVMLIK
jgi:hypothetical protein